MKKIILLILSCLLLVTFWFFNQSSSQEEMQEKSFVSEEKVTLNPAPSPQEAKIKQEKPTIALNEEDLVINKIAVLDSSGNKITGAQVWAFYREIKNEEFGTLSQLKELSDLKVKSDSDGFVKLNQHIIKKGFVWIEAKGFVAFQVSRKKLLEQKIIMGQGGRLELRFLDKEHFKEAKIKLTSRVPQIFSLHEELVIDLVESEFVSKNLFPTSYDLEVEYLFKDGYQRKYASKVVLKENEIHQVEVKTAFGEHNFNVSWKNVGVLDELKLELSRKRPPFAVDTLDLLHVWKPGENEEFQFSSLPSGNYRLEVNTSQGEDGSLFLKEDFLIEGDQSFKFDLGGGEASGNIVVYFDPLPKFSKFILMESGNGAFREFKVNESPLLLPRLKAGSYLGTLKGQRFECRCSLNIGAGTQDIHFLQKGSTLNFVKVRKKEEPVYGGIVRVIQSKSEFYLRQDILVDEDEEQFEGFDSGPITLAYLVEGIPSFERDDVLWSGHNHLEIQVEASETNLEVVLDSVLDQPELNLYQVGSQKKYTQKYWDDKTALIKNVEPGDYHLSVFGFKQGQPLIRKMENLNIVEGITNKVELKVWEQGQAELFVKVIGWGPNAMLRMKKQDGSVVVPSTPNKEKGEFLYQGLKLGVYELHFQHQNRRLQRQLKLEANSLNYEFYALTEGQIKLDINYEGEVSKTFLMLKGKQNSENARPDEKGRYHFKNVFSDTYELHAIVDGKRYTEKFQFSDGESKEIVMNLPKPPSESLSISKDSPEIKSSLVYVRSMHEYPSISSGIFNQGNAKLEKISQGEHQMLVVDGHKHLLQSIQVDEGENFKKIEVFNSKGEANLVVPELKHNQLLLFGLDSEIAQSISKDKLGHLFFNAKASLGMSLMDILEGGNRQLVTLPFGDQGDESLDKVRYQRVEGLTEMHSNYSVLEILEDGQVNVLSNSSINLSSGNNYIKANW